MAIDVGSVVNFDFSGVIRWALIIMQGLLVALVGVVVYVLFQYKYDVTIFEKFKDGLRIRKDRGCTYASKGVKGFKLLFKRGVRVPADYVDYSYMKSGFVLFGVHKLFLFMDALGEFHPIKFTNSEPVFSVIPQQIHMWAEMQREENRQAYANAQSFFQQYGTLIGVTVLLATIILLAILYKDIITDLLSMAQSVFNMVQQQQLPTVPAVGG